MEELINSIITDESPSAISDSIKDILTAKVMDKIEEYRPQVAVSMFDTSDE
jgi:hypothetical protein